MNLIRQFIKIAKLLIELKKKYPDYVVFSFTMGCERLEKRSYVKYNIYTPTISHNSFSTFKELIRFIKLLLKDGDKHIRIKVLEDQRDRAKENMLNAKSTFEKSKEELEKLNEN